MPSPLPSERLELLLDCDTQTEAKTEEAVLKRTDAKAGQTGLERLSAMHPLPKNHQLRIAEIVLVEPTKPSGALTAVTLKIVVLVEPATAFDTTDSRLVDDFKRRAKLWCNSFVATRSTAPKQAR